MSAGYRQKIESLSGRELAIISRLDMSGDCWLWTGPLNNEGRGRLYWRGSNKMHHRVVWEILVGPIPEGAFVCHHCDNPTCANPEHMYLGDQFTNMRDMISRGRHWAQKNPEEARKIGKKLIAGYRHLQRGPGSPNAKLTIEQVAAIRTMEKPVKLFASEFGVSETTVLRAKRGETYL